ncbi:MAG: membrane protein insertase YidC, partial [Bacteroidales bacterium]|nr:membrane protein insertase YidC [Bacteroidales bacterium]
MDRNSIIGIIIIAGILILWTTLNKPSKDEIEATKYKRDSLELVRQQQIIQQEKVQATQIQNTQTEVATSTSTSASADKSQLKSMYGSFAESAEGKQEFTILENELLKVKISNKGGRIYSVELKDYKTYSQKSLTLFDGDSTVFGLNFFSENRSIITNDLFFVPSEVSENSVKMRLFAGDNRYIEYVYTLSPESYMVDFDINFVGINEVIASYINVIDLKWAIYSPQQEKGAKNENMYTTLGYKYYQDEVNTLSSRSKDENKEELNTKLKWISFQQQFFSSILVADNYFSNAIIEFTNIENSDKYLKYFESTIGIPFEYIAKSTVPLSFYFGPNHYTTLKK